MGEFDRSYLLSHNVYTGITDFRVREPQRVVELAQARRRRDPIAPDGRLCLLAADHPARAVTTVREDDLAMADRCDYLSRIVHVLEGRGVDGIMATMDLLEELLIIDHLQPEPSFLDDKLMIASLNRGGLEGSAWELDDPLTGPTPDVADAMGFDGGKILLRLDLDDADSLKTLVSSAQLISELSAYDMPAFLEPLPVRFEDGELSVVKSAAPLAVLAGVASALGDTSRNLWLKLPYCEDFERVAAATTLPILLLGGPASSDPDGFLAEIEAAMNAAANVRGVMVGRNVLYPVDRDPRDVAEAVARLVH